MDKFPLNGVFIYCGDSEFHITTDLEGKQLSRSLAIPGLRFKIIGQPVAHGFTIRAKAEMWVRSEVYKGFVTLYDDRGYQAVLVHQRERQAGVVDAKAIQNQGDEAPVLDVGEHEVTWGEKRFRKLLGSGAFGQVYKTTIDLDGMGPIPVAMKRPFDNQQAKELFIEEMRVMQDVAKVAEVKWQTLQLVHAQMNPLAMAVEFSPYGDLDHHVKFFQRHPGCFWRIIGQVSMVFKAMDQLNHRDIKPQNILLFPSKDGTEVNFKLGDFGLATNDGDKSLWGGTPGYLPPEAFGKSNVVNRSADVYALGVTVLNMLVGNSAVEKIRGRDSACKTQINCAVRVYKSVNRVIHHYKASFPDESAGAHMPELAGLLELMTHPSPATRTTFEELFEMMKNFMDSTYRDVTCPVSLLKSM